jgi:hypothetical protein
MSSAAVMPIAHQNAPWKALLAPWARSDWRATATIAVPPCPPGREARHRQPARRLARAADRHQQSPRHLHRRRRGRRLLRPARILSIVDELFLPLAQTTALDAGSRRNA